MGAVPRTSQQLCVAAELFMSALEASARHEPCGPSFDTLPTKGCERVVSFYYNVWKTRAVPQAQAWYCRMEQVGAPAGTCCVSVCFAAGSHNATG